MTSKKGAPEWRALGMPLEAAGLVVAEGLAQCGMSYDDLILSLIADRVDLLLRERRGSAGHLVELLTICEA